MYAQNSDDDIDGERCPYCGKYPVVGPPGCCAKDGYSTYNEYNTVDNAADESYSYAWFTHSMRENSCNVYIQYIKIIKESILAQQLLLSDNSKHWFPRKYCKSLYHNDKNYISCPEWLFERKRIPLSLVLQALPPIEISDYVDTNRVNDNELLTKIKQSNRGEDEDKNLNLPEYLQYLAFEMRHSPEKAKAIHLAHKVVKRYIDLIEGKWFSRR